MPNLLETLAAIGTAETPADPIRGLILLVEKRFMIFAMITPAAVPNENAKSPSTIIPSVSRLRNLSADSLLPTPSPRKIVTILISAFCAVSLHRLTTPDSRIRFPNIRKPIRGAADGRSNVQRPMRTIGKMIFSR